MCGICGIAFKEGNVNDEKVLVGRMNDVLTHRGPDGDGIHAGNHVILGHRRLSIIDLGGGAQPMYNDDRSLVITFNGEIYNYVEIKADLEKKGHTFATDSDTEVILHLYADKGINCVDDLNGMFAFAIWDEKNNTLFAARDRLGEKPLYYHHDRKSGRLVFASELKAVLLDNRINRKLSATALDDYLAYGYVPLDRCIVDGVQKLPPGHRLVWQDGCVRTDAYWDTSFPERTISNEQEWVDELSHRIAESVRIRLRSDVPLGVFLSGGIDSSAVVAVASEVSGRRVKTFSVGFQEADFDEMQYARMVVDKYNTDHQEIIVKDSDISILPDLVYHLDEPFADPSALPTYHVCREARQHVTVCLSGDGADEVFAGYGRYKEAQRHQKWHGVTDFGIRQLASVVPKLLPRHTPGRGAIERVAARGPDLYYAQMCKFTLDERTSLFRPEYHPDVHRSPWLFEPYFAGRNGSSIVTTLQHADQKTYLPDDILVKVDRMSMKTSLEVRVPFLDHTLVEFVNGVTADWKLRDGVSKYVLKQSVGPRLPEPLLKRKKMGFGIPIKHWFRGSLQSHAKEVLLSSNSRAQNWLSPAAIESVIGDHQKGGRDLSRKIWALLVFEHWCQKFNV